MKFILQSKGIYQCKTCSEFFGIMNCAEPREMGFCLNCKNIIGGIQIKRKNKHLFPKQDPRTMFKTKKDRKNKMNVKIEQKVFKKIIEEKMFGLMREKYNFHKKLMFLESYGDIAQNFFLVGYLFSHLQFLILNQLHKEKPIAGFDDYFSNRFDEGNFA